MTDILDRAINQAVDLYTRQVGEGDLTTENFFPYPRHTVAEIVTEGDIPGSPIPILEALMKHADAATEVRTYGDSDGIIPAGARVARLEGNGRAILTGWRVAGRLMSQVCSVQRAAKEVVDQLQSARIDVTHNFDLPIGYEKLICYAVEQAGGVSFGTGLDETVYISRDHIEWVGSLEKAISKTIEEVGGSRSLIKVIVELTGPDQATALKDRKIDFAYCKSFTPDDIRHAGELTKGWVKLMVDESISVDEVKSLRDSGVRLYMVDLSKSAKSRNLFSIHFEAQGGS